MPKKTLENLIQETIKERTIGELTLGWLRYETLRKFNPRQFSELNAQNLKGQNFDNLVTKRIPLPELPPELPSPTKPTAPTQYQKLPEPEKKLMPYKGNKPKKTIPTYQKT